MKKIFDGDWLVATAWAEKCSGPGWTNDLIWVLLAERGTSNYRVEAIQSDEFTPEMWALFEVSAAATKSMQRTVSSHGLRLALEMGPALRPVDHPPPYHYCSNCDAPTDADDITCRHCGGTNDWACSRCGYSHEEGHKDDCPIVGQYVYPMRRDPPDPVGGRQCDRCFCVISLAAIRCLDCEWGTFPWVCPECGFTHSAEHGSDCPTQKQIDKPTEEK